MNKSSKSSKLTKLVRKNKTKQQSLSASTAMVVYKPPSSSQATARVMTSALPANIGASMPRSTFGFGGKPQAIADFDPDSSLRIVGRDLFYAPIQAGSSTVAAGFGGTATYYAAITPKEIANRLQNIQAIFQWYAIRGLRIFYAPATGSTSTVQIALGYLSNYEISNDITAPTQTQVLEMQPAALFPAWQPAVIDVIHRGTKLFSCDSKNVSATNSFDYYQGVLACTLINGVASVEYGQLWMEYIVDFYQPCPILATLSRSISLQGSSRVAFSVSSHRDAAPLVRVGGYLKHAVVPALESKFVSPSDDDTEYNVPPPAFAGAPSNTPSGVRSLEKLSSLSISTSSAALAPAAPKGYFR